MPSAANTIPELPEIFKANLAALQQRIHAACAKSGRDPESVQLLPVTKTLGPEAIALCAQAGLNAVGENRVQECVAKKNAYTQSAGCAANPVQWELIGPLQRNKANAIAPHITRIHTLACLKLTQKLAAARMRANMGAPLRALVQINIGADPAKAGILPQHAHTFFEGWAQLQENKANQAHEAFHFLHLEGLMCIPPLPGAGTPPPAAHFAALRTLRDELESAHGLPLPQLSMGMSADFEAAIAEGSTCVRLGSALFGPRT